ncbi:hypothetical protein BS50DRAFT_114079 [Corynespora cassiicola Philippines]|uniref:Uncharacterized protein n=1 Tax=Corynespora cassiicola Philippines TaxID=1448308 RepID=A0A2T2NDF1_CORCC|nr:hypothetical protein BS50DRAFT_114079 [Corynespora cassiicola Philippines]
MSEKPPPPSGQRVGWPGFSLVAALFLLLVLLVFPAGLVVRRRLVVVGGGPRAAVQARRGDRHLTSNRTDLRCCGAAALAGYATNSRSPRRAVQKEGRQTEKDARRRHVRLRVGCGREKARAWAWAWVGERGAPVPLPYRVVYRCLLWLYRSGKPSPTRGAPSQLRARRLPLGASLEARGARRSGCNIARARRDDPCSTGWLSPTRGRASITAGPNAVKRPSEHFRVRSNAP